MPYHQIQQSQSIFLMKQQQSSINLIMKGYDTYAVLKGGKNVIKFSDNSDIATDKNPTPIEVAPKGEKNPIKWIPRGRNNHMPYDIMKKSVPTSP